MNCKQIESLVVAIRGGYKISETFAHCFDINGEANPLPVHMTHPRQGTQFCDRDVPLMGAKTVLQGLKSYGNPCNKARLTKYLLASFMI